MPKKSPDYLFRLIKSLSKAEKRNFKLFAGRHGQTGDHLFVRLFDAIDGLPVNSEDEVRRRLGAISSTQLANAKRHLYTQLMRSLRLLSVAKHTDLEIREQLDFARILYEKGLYLQALRTLERLRTKAANSQLHILHLEVIESIKFIEERHITRSRSTKGKMEALLLDSDRIERDTSNIARLSSLKIRIHGLYITAGHAKSHADKERVDRYFSEQKAEVREGNLTVIERVYLHQAYMWYHYILLEYDQCFIHARSWVQLCDKNPEMKHGDPALYMRGLSYVLTSLFRLKRYREYDQWLDVFEVFSSTVQDGLSMTSRILHDLYLGTARINSHIMKGSFARGIALVPRITEQIREYGNLIDVHRRMVFNYKIAYLFFGASDFDTAISYLNKIIQLKVGHLRTDIQCYARMLHLICHFELQHHQLMPYLADSVARFFDRVDDVNVVQKELLSFFRQHAANPFMPQSALFRLKAKLEQYTLDRYQRQAFEQLDVLTWVESKIHRRSIEETVRAQYFLAGAGTMKN